MESPLKCENLLKMDENLQKIDDNLLKVGENMKGLSVNENAKGNAGENEKNADESSVDAEEIGEQAMNSIHLPYKHIAMKSGKNLRSKLLKVSVVWSTLARPTLNSLLSRRSTTGSN